MKDKKIGMAMVYRLGFMVFSVIGLMIIAWVMFNVIDESYWFYVNWFLNVLGAVVVAYSLYSLLWVILCFGEYITLDESVIDFFKKRRKQKEE